MGVNSVRKEFAPIGANSFLTEQTPCWKSCVIQKSKQQVTKVVSLCKNGRKTWSVSEFLLDNSGTKCYFLCIVHNSILELILFVK